MSDRLEFARPSYRPEQRSGGLDPDMRRMAIAAAGIGGVLALVIFGLSLTRHASRTIPVIQALPGPVRVKPADPGGMKVAGAEESGDGQAEAVSPLPEKPAIGALRAKEKAARPALLAEAPKPPPVAPAPQIERASATQSMPAPAAAAPAPALTQTMQVQLAAFESMAAAQQEWGRISGRMPDLFGGLTPDVVQAKLAGRTVWRLRTGHFPTLAAAAEFCGKIRAQGSDCSIAAF